MTDVTEITTDELNAQRDELTIVDIRDADDFAGGHIPGAENIPLDDIEEAAADREWDGQVAVICYRGNSSIPATKLLDTHTGADAVSVAGGFQAWDGPVTDPVSNQ